MALVYDASALRLFETDADHGLSIAESCLMALARTPSLAPVP